MYYKLRLSDNKPDMYLLSMYTFFAGADVPCVIMNGQLQIDYVGVRDR